GDDVLGFHVAFLPWLQRGEDETLISRSRAAASEGGGGKVAFEIGLALDDFRHLVHIVQRVVGVRAERTAEDGNKAAAVLHGRELALEIAVGKRGEQGDEGGGGECDERPGFERAVEHFAEDLVHEGEARLGHAVEPAVRRVAGDGVFPLEQDGAEHGRDRQRHGGGDEHGDGEGNAELIEQAAGGAGLEGHGKEDRGQREGGGDDGEGDLSRAEHGGLHAGLAFFHAAVDVFQHHDGVIH